RSFKPAIEDIAPAGYPGIQLRRDRKVAPTGTETVSIFDEFKSAEALKAELERAHLTFACVSGGGPSADPAKRKDEVEKFMTLAKFAKEAGALSIQATSGK